MKRLLVLASHPDDECLLLYGAYQVPGYEVSLTVACSHWLGDKQREAFEASCSHLGSVASLLLPYPNDFYRLPHRPVNELGRFVNDIKRIVRDEKPDGLYVDNMHGTYGNLSHVFLHNVAKMVFDGPIFFPDLLYEINWPVPPSYTMALRGVQCARVCEARATDAVKAARQEYMDRGCFTWSFKLFDEHSVMQM